MENLKLQRKIKENGITLVALVVTIIILLILAGISISALTNTGIFEEANQAKEKVKNAEKEQNKILDEYETELDQYNENTLVYKVNNGEIKIGDYVKYEQDIVLNTDEKYKTLLSNLATYSGSNENTELTLLQDELNWRIFDVKDGRVRLISEEPTNSKINLYGYNGYNNAVKLLDDSCRLLYNSSKFSYNVQNLKIEDISKYMNIQPKIDLNIYNLNNIRYPKILEYEEEQYVAKNMLPKIGYSEQNEWMIGKDNSNVSSLKNTFWMQSINEEGNFKDSIYYILFIKDKSIYWLSSRCVHAFSYACSFDIRFCSSNGISAYGIYTTDVDKDGGNFKFRPVVTLNSNVQLDTTETADGSDANHAYVIK